MNHASILRRNTHQAIASCPELAKAIPEIIQNMERNYSKLFVDSVVQKARENIDVYDAYALFWVFSMLQEGRLASTVVPVPGEPRQDCNRQANNAILADLAPPFHAEFVGGIGNGRTDDGAFGWSRPVTLNYTPEPERFDALTAPPSRLLLEVGTTASSRTYTHLKTISPGGGLARWPYGSRFVVVYWIIPPEPRNTPVRDGQRTEVKSVQNGQISELSAFWNRRKLKA